MDHSDAPYLDALVEYAARDAGRYHVPGHKGGIAATPELFARLTHVLELDIPACTRGIDLGPGATPLDQAKRLAADAWGARRTWFLVNGASEASHVVCLALAQAGERIVVQRNAHSSLTHGLVLAGLLPSFVGPEIDHDLGIAHCVTPEALDAALAATPSAVAAVVVSPTYFGAAADLRELARVSHARGVPLIVDEAWGAHFRFHDSLPDDALAAGADLVISGTHKLVGSLTQSAMLHLGHEALEPVEETALVRAFGLVRSTSPSSLLVGSLDAARRHAVLKGRDLLDEGLADMAQVRQAVNALPGLRALDAGLVGRWGIHDFDLFRLAIDVRGSGVDGHLFASALHATADINLELATATTIIAHFGMGEPVRDQGLRLVEAFEHTLGRVGEIGVGAPLAVPAPAWGPLELSPREAFFAPHELVPIEAAAGRVSAESVVVYPPGIPNVMPGEVLTPENITHLQAMVERGCMLRGTAGDALDALRVVKNRSSSRGRGPIT